MIIRTIEKVDLPQVADLYQGFWGEKSDIARMEDALEKMNLHHSHIILVAQEDDAKPGDKLLGTVMGVICPDIYGDCRPFLVLENMIVRREARQRGVGRQLVHTLEAEARERGCTQILLLTEKGRHDAVEFYNSLGYDPHPMQGYKKKL